MLLFNDKKGTKITKACTLFKSLHYNGSNNFLYVNDVKIYQFKVKGLDMKPHLICVSNISKSFADGNIELNLTKWIYMIFFADYGIFDISNIVDIHKDVMG